MKTYAERLARDFPKLSKVIKPRIYKGADKFNNYRRIFENAYEVFLSFGCLCANSEWKQSLSDEKRNAIIRRAWFNYIQSLYNFPFFFVTKELFRAAMDTDIKFIVDWESLNLPFPNATFILEKGCLEVDTREVIYLSYIRRTSAMKENFQRFANDALGSNPFENNDDKQITETGFNMIFATDTMVTELLLDKPYDSADRDYDVVGRTRPEIINTSEILMKAMFNLLLVMEARPDLIEAEAKHGLHKKSGETIWTPNLVGKNYRYKHSQQPENAAGTHASPRMHWRRGHLRQQRFGVGLGETKIIWIEPSLIGVQNTQAVCT